MMSAAEAKAQESLFSLLYSDTATNATNVLNLFGSNRREFNSILSPDGIQCVWRLQGEGVQGDGHGPYSEAQNLR